MDFSSILKIKTAWDAFTRNHPKFMPFIQAVGREAVGEGTIIEIKVVSPEGQEYTTNMKLSKSDMDLLEQVKNMTYTSAP